MKVFKSRKYAVIAVIFIILIARNINCRNQSISMPEYEKKDISAVVKKSEKSNDDYSFLFEQTGLSREAVDVLISTGSEDTLFELNNLMFEKPQILKKYILFPFTSEERSVDRTIPIAPLKDGDILVTFNTITCDWRHGHCAIVADAKNNIILEHRAAGALSCFSDVQSWGTYPSFAVLRYPDEQKAKEAADYAINNLVGIKYNALTGLIKKDKSDEDIPSASQCSHIVWQAYKAVGVDIDRDKGFIVTPENIADSEKLETVQIFGINR